MDVAIVRCWLFVAGKVIVKVADEIVGAAEPDGEGV